MHSPTLLQQNVFIPKLIAHKIKKFQLQKSYFLILKFIINKVLINILKAILNGSFKPNWLYSLSGRINVDDDL